MKKVNRLLGLVLTFKIFTLAYFPFIDYASALNAPRLSAGQMAPFCLSYDELDSSLKVKNTKYLYFYRWCDQTYNDSLIKPGEYNSTNRNFYQNNTSNAEGSGLYMSAQMNKSIGYGPHIMEIITLKKDVDTSGSRSRKNIYLYSTSNQWYVAKQFRDVWFRPFYGSSYSDSEIYKIARNNGYSSQQQRTIEEALVNRNTDFLWIIYQGELQCFHHFGSRQNPFRQTANQSSYSKRRSNGRRKLKNHLDLFYYAERKFRPIPNELCPLRARITVFNYDFYRTVYGD